MRNEDSSARSDQPIWNPGKFALWIQRWPGLNDASPTTVLLRHPTSPYLEPPLDKIDESAIQGCAYRYLNEVSRRAEIDPRLKLPDSWLAALAPNASSLTFGWLPVGWPLQKYHLKARAEPLASFVVERKKPDGTPAERSVVLLASERLGDTFLGSGFGLRVVVHVRKTDEEKYEVRITGMSASLPFGLYRSAGVSSLRLQDAREAQGFLQSLLKDDFKTEIASSLGLRKDSARFRGLRLAKLDGRSWQVERRGTGVGKADSIADDPSYWKDHGKGVPDKRANETPYAFVFVGTDLKLGSLVSKVPLVADVATPGHAWLFPRDPASNPILPNVPSRKRRPTRSQAQLHQFRVEETIGPNQNVELKYPNTPSDHYLEVVQTRFVRGDNAAGGIKAVDLPGDGPPIRSNDFAAVSAFAHLPVQLPMLFDRLNRYGIDPNAYFRVARLPLKVAYRSGVRPGPGKDGQTVNARVLPEGCRVDFVGPTELGDHPSLEIHLALANLSHRARKPWDRVHRSPAEPLGIAADSRWIWHEIGHVLLMASVGELEFRFAHSAGDALAAIVADPQSRLATDPLLRDNLRGATFPWVFNPRRHDRSVLLGWSWCGSMHRALSLLPDADRLRRKGYRSEQILSSSLFRLYLCLGGDTTQVQIATPGVVVRESASYYAVYLIIKGIGLLGEPGVEPANHADQFVSALIDADTATEQWTVTVPIEGVSTTFKRTGGCAHKVIRWAFEAQGLYAADPVKITNAPGVPGPVDIYIRDDRPLLENTPCGDIQYGPGSYVPVSLDWDLNQTGSGAPPARPKWQAENTAIDLRGGNIFVTVGNRGSQNARNVKVRVWWREWFINTAPPEWDKGQGWTEYKPKPRQDIAPGASREFGPFRPASTVSKRYLVFAQASCKDDRANTDAIGGLPCSRLSTALVDLVANDNNLGLRVIGNP